MKTWKATFGAICMVAGFAATAAPLTLTGAELLTAPNASFPSVQPTIAGSSIVFEWGTSHGPPWMNLIRYHVNPGQALPPTGDVSVSAIWNITRLSCEGWCSAGSGDWDPYFALSDGSTMVGFGLTDNGDGSIMGVTDVDLGPSGSNRVSHWQNSNLGYPSIGDALTVALTFTLHDVGLTAEIEYLGIVTTWTTAFTLSRTNQLALVFSQDNDSGERYQVNYVQFPDATEITEPSTVVLLGLGIAGLAAARHRKS